MLRELGFGGLPTDVVWAASLCLLILAVTTGWVADSILQAQGFGLFGNAFLAFAGAFAALVLFARFGWVSPDTTSMSGASVAGAFCGVLLPAMLRRLAR
jgi:uncharacterized membrane protein YeaQ/YmgE (transglycosylase-associated protein family)